MAHKIDKTDWDAKKAKKDAGKGKIKNATKLKNLNDVNDRLIAIEEAIGLR